MMVCCRRGKKHGRLQESIACRIRHSIPFRMDHQIPIQDTEGTDSRTITGTPPPGMRSPWHHNRPRQYYPGSRPHAPLMPANLGSQQDSPVPEGQIIPSPPGTVPGIEKAILGTAPMGVRILLLNRRRSHGRDDKGLHRKPAGTGHSRGIQGNRMSSLTGA